ncbi:hypothetical protein [Rubinisphaera italica]|nr:hypothetical protein [Rubinisphaera italica]
MSWDSNTYFRPGLVYERISHDSSSHASVNYFRWLHGPIPYEPGPSEYARITNSARPEPLKAPQLRVDPPMQNQIPQSGPQFQPDSNPPQAPPVEIVVPPELTPYPERNLQIPVPPAPFEDQSLQPPTKDGPTAYQSGPKRVQPAGYRGSSRLSMTNVIFARP